MRQPSCSPRPFSLAATGTTTTSYQDGGGYGAYYVAPPEYYAGFYPPRWAAPRYYMPRAYLPYEVYDRGGYRSDYAGRERFYAGDCEIKRKWRRGRYYEKIDCDD